MKRVKLFGLTAVMLSMIIAGGLWAQDLKFDGYFNSGVGVISSGVENSDTVIKAFGADSEQNGYRFRLNGAYQNEAGNAGVKLRFQSQATLGQTGGYLSLPFAYGWVKFVNDIFYAAGGIVEDATWATGDWWLNSERIDWGLGALLKATPIKGLDLGFGAYVVNVNAGGNNNTLAAGSGGFGGLAPKIGDVKYTFSGAYTAQDLFRLAATFRWKNQAGHDTSTNYNGYAGRDESSRLFGEFRFLGVKELTAIVAASFDRIEDFSNNGDIILSETFAYKLDDLSIGLNAAQFLYVRQTDNDPSLLFNLWGSYAIGNIVPRLDLAFFLGGQSAVGAAANSAGYTWARPRAGGFANKAGVSGTEDDYSLFSVRPSVKFNLDGRTFVEIGDLINYDFANFNAYGGEESRLSNVFYIDFKWTF